MHNFESEGKCVGLIFDVSIRHDINGKRIIDILKKQTIDIIRELLIDGEDYFYLYHPEIQESVLSHAESVCAIGNYNTDGWEFNVNYALRHTLYVLMSDDMTFKKYLILITDRLCDKNAIEKAIFLDKKENIDCHFFVVGIGEFFQKNLFEKTIDLKNVTLIHLNSALDLKSDLFKEKHGEDLCGTTSEQCE